MRDSIALNEGKGKKEGARPQPVMPDPDPTSILFEWALLRRGRTLDFAFLSCHYSSPIQLFNNVP